MEDNFLKYFDSELSEAEREKLILELIKNPAQKAEFEQLLKSWSVSALTATSVENVDIAEEYKNILNQINKSEVQNTRSSQVLIPLKSVLKYAAVVLFLIGFGITSYFYLKPQEEIAFNEISTKTGEKAHIKLSDGTSIWLNASSKLRYPNVLNGKKVDVYLQGEAYFDVTHVGNRLFQVHTSDLNIKVLGTAFNVKSYPEEKITETTLVRGKVRIEGKSEDSDDFVILLPNQKASYLGNHSKLIVTESISKNMEARSDDVLQLKEIASRTNATVVLSNFVNTKYETSWKDGRLEFVDEQFSSLAVKMERWFGVNIYINDPQLRSVRYTGTFEKQNIEQALKALSISLPFKYVISKDSIIINK
jgi:ferric-dicitrate binding protein FerR (iron transport regulator)